MASVSQQTMSASAPAAREMAADTTAELDVVAAGDEGEIAPEQDELTVDAEQLAMFLGMGDEPANASVTAAMAFDPTTGAADGETPAACAARVAPLSGKAAALLWRTLCVMHPAFMNDNMLKAFEAGRSTAAEGTIHQYQQLGAWSRVLSATTAACTGARRKLAKHHKDSSAEHAAEEGTAAAAPKRTFQDFYLDQMSGEFESDIAQICKDENLGQAGASKLIDSLEAGIDIFEPLEKKLRVESLKRPYHKAVSSV